MKRGEAMRRRPSQRAVAAVTIVAIATIALALGVGVGCTPLTRRSSPPTHRRTANQGTGVYHTVRKGETLWRISKTYGVSIAEITEANGLSDFTINAGQRLFIPGVAREREVTPAYPRTDETAGRPDAKLSWPLAGRGRSSVTSGFGMREDPNTGASSFHKGIDIDGAREERVLAAAAGEIVFAGRMSGFGIVVMIDHGSRLITVYGHLSRAAVKLEDVVERGQVIGYVGTTGNARGTHLHFEVRHKGVSVDPLEYLP
jgi:murein DD-endopeptidase MepM/ murein hydrolase activator NlpD